MKHVAVNRAATEMDSEMFELVSLASGVCSLRCASNREVFHPVIGPVAEARTVHLAGSRLVERANESPAGEFVIWDVGLGAAANALTAIEALRSGYRGAADIALHSFDRTLAPLRFAVEHADALGYLAGWTDVLRRFTAGVSEVKPLPLAGGGSGHSPTLKWRVHLAEFGALIASAKPIPSPNVIFFDPYSAASNPTMWTLEMFAGIYCRLEPGTPCLLTTYTRSTAIRVTLLLAGFYVGSGRATGEKEETTVASNRLALLEHPLPQSWLKRVSASTSAAPLRGETFGRQPISEADMSAIRAHPQFR